MSLYAVYFGPIFRKKFSGLDSRVKEWGRKMVRQLAENPNQGKMLRVSWFREKKFEKIRMYYLISERVRAIYFVNMSAKKDQSQVIAAVLLFVDKYKEELENAVETASSSTELDEIDQI